jgi:hypothetical protein
MRYVHVHGPYFPPEKSPWWYALIAWLLWGSIVFWTTWNLIPDPCEQEDQACWQELDRHGTDCTTDADCYQKHPELGR